MNPEIVRQTQAQVAGLLADFPELAEDEQLRADVIEGETDFHRVIRRLVIEAKAAEAEAEGVAETRRKLDEDFGGRYTRHSNRAERLRNAVFSLMNTANLRKMKFPEATLSVSYRGPRPVRPESADGLPDEYVKIERKPNWEKIKAAIQAGETVPGVTKSNGTEILTIR